jgi:hypothetical protein
MAENEQRSVSIPWLPLLTFMAVSSGVLIYFQQLTSSRPGGGDPALVDTFDDKTIDARLWQDPLAVAIADGELTDGKTGKKRDSEPHSIAGFQHVFIDKCFDDQNSDWHKSSASSEDDSPNEKVTRVLVLGVFTPGGPYVEDIERRLRSRRAVVEALGSNWEKQGYDPQKGHEIGYFCVPWLPAQPTIARAVERLQANRDRDEGRGTRESSEPCGLRIKGVSIDYVMRSQSSLEPETHKLLVPYEWFEPDTYGAQKTFFDHVLVLWLTDEAFWDAPAARLADFISWFRVRALDPIQGQHSVFPTFKILGPDNSGALHEMLLEAEQRKWDSVTRQCLGAVHMYSSQASAADSQLFADLPVGRDVRVRPDSKSLLEERINLQESTNFQFERTNLTDDHIVESLVSELRIQGLSEGDHVALISEEDTYYARALSSTFMQGNEKAEKPFTISSYSYLRGIDGKLPVDGVEKGNAGYEQENSSTSQVGKNTPSSKRPEEQTEGVNQADDIRRLADRLRMEDEEWKAAGKPGLKAIGLLGSDVYDKLELLKALRPIFPDIVFFTNHLEARFAHPDEWRETHNLLIVSDYGLSMSDPERKRGTLREQSVGPFRDSGQTALYEATLEAIGGITAENHARPTHPVIYEVGRNGFTRLGLPNEALRDSLIPLLRFTGVTVVLCLLFGRIWSISRVTVDSANIKATGIEPE